MHLTIEFHEFAVPKNVTLCREYAYICFAKLTLFFSPRFCRKLFAVQTSILFSKEELLSSCILWFVAQILLKSFAVSMMSSSFTTDMTSDLLEVSTISVHYARDGDIVEYLSHFIEFLTGVLTR